MHRGGTARVLARGKRCAAFAVPAGLCYLCGMARTVRVYARVLPEIYRGLEEMAKRGGYRSVPNFVTTLLNRMAYTAAARQEARREEARREEAWREEERLHTPTAEEEIAEMFGEYTDAEAPRYGERTKRTRRTEYW